MSENETLGVRRQHSQMLFVFEQPRIHLARQVPGVLRDNARHQDVLPGNLGDTSDQLRIAVKKLTPNLLAQIEFRRVWAARRMRCVPRDGQVQYFEKVVARPRHGKFSAWMSRNMYSFEDWLIKSDASKQPAGPGFPRFIIAEMDGCRLRSGIASARNCYQSVGVPIGRRSDRLIGARQR